MTSSQGELHNDRALPKNIRNRTDSCEDEIDLIDYFRVLWKRKYFIVLGSALPALLVGLNLFLSPGKYKLTYLYNIGLTEKSYKTLLDRFYSAENFAKLTAKLRENEIDGRSQRMIPVDVQLEASPSNFRADAARTTNTTNRTTNIANLQKIKEVESTSLAMTILGRSHKDVEKMSSIVRDNFEKILPIYDAKEELNIAIVDSKTKMADIEENKFSLELELQKKRAISAKLRNLEPADSNKIPSGIVLQFDNVGQNSEYLPLAYQIQATDANIVSIEETIRENEQKCDYYERLVSLNERLVGEIENRASSYYTVQQFHSWLTDIVGDYEDKELADYLNAYIKKLENVISTNTPVVEKPSVNSIPKASVKKRSTMVFVLFLIMTTFAAFLLEAVQKRKKPAS
ncbi:MAG: hypothetical protein JSW59_19225 [Phycisphaerales bacterium]|nr:MAG: hypothetical protein JSW59_19225 [Phycisphaerales bacterium]